MFYVTSLTPGSASPTVDALRQQAHRHLGELLDHCARGGREGREVSCEKMRGVSEYIREKKKATTELNTSQGDALSSSSCVMNRTSAFCASVSTMGSMAAHTRALVSVGAGEVWEGAVWF